MDRFCATFPGKPTHYPCFEESLHQERWVKGLPFEMSSLLSEGRQNAKVWEVLLFNLQNQMERILNLRQAQRDTRTHGIGPIKLKGTHWNLDRITSKTYKAERRNPETLVLAKRNADLSFHGRYRSSPHSGLSSFSWRTGHLPLRKYSAVLLHECQGSSSLAFPKRMCGRLPGQLGTGERAIPKPFKESWIETWR